MKAIKKINNNVAVCLDSKGNELIAFGKGIGFKEMPYEIDDLSLINRTFYGINQNYVNLLNEVHEEIFEISAKIVDSASIHLDNVLNSNIVFTLADHINFAIKRYESNVSIKMPIAEDIKHLYETEYEIGKSAVQYINKVKNIHLGKDEAIGIALHFINAENVSKNVDAIANTEEIVSKVIDCIENECNIKVNKDSFNYSRFVTHIEYLVKRCDKKIQVASSNNELFETLMESYPQTYLIANNICVMLKTKYGWDLNREEMVYLMMHVNRLCSREDCYQ